MNVCEYIQKNEMIRHYPEIIERLKVKAYWENRAELLLNDIMNLKIDFSLVSKISNFLDDLKNTHFILTNEVELYYNRCNKILNWMVSELSVANGNFREDIKFDAKRHLEYLWEMFLKTFARMIDEMEKSIVEEIEKFERFIETEPEDLDWFYDADVVSKDIKRKKSTPCAGEYASDDYVEDYDWWDF